MDPAATDMPEASYELTLEGEGVTVRRSIDPAMAATILQMVVGGGGMLSPMTQRASGTTRPPAATAQSIPGTVPQQRDFFEDLSPGEYLDEVEAKRNPDKIVALASWLKIYQERETFTTDEIKDLFDRSGEVMPKNFSRDFKWAQQVRWITETRERDVYRLTKRGQEAINERFSPEIIKASRQPAGRRNRSANGSGSDSDGADD